MGWMFRLRMKPKLVVVLLLTTMVPLALVVGFSIDSATEGLRAQTAEQLAAVRENKKANIQQYFQTIRNQVQNFSANPMITEAMAHLPSAFAAYRQQAGIDGDKLKVRRAALGDFYADGYERVYRQKNKGKDAPAGQFLRQIDADAVALQADYLQANPQPIDEKHHYLGPQNGTRYAGLHRQLHPAMRRYLEKFGYYDIFLVDSETGKILYSVFKEVDFATSLKDGPFAESGIGRAFREANRAESREAVALADFSPYPPSYDAPAGFIASPVFQEGKKVGVAIFQIPLDRITAVMGERTGLGETGDSYLVGPDKRMRSDSYRDSQGHSVVASFRGTVADNGVQTPAVRQALAGETGTEVLKDYSGRRVLSAFAPVNLPGGLHWAIIVEQELAEIYSPIRQIRNDILIMGLIVAILAGLVGYGLAHTLTRPLNDLAHKANLISKGRLDVAFPRHMTDETGDLSRAMESMVESLGGLVGQLRGSGLGAGRIETGKMESDGLSASVGRAQSIAQTLKLSDTLLNSLGEGVFGIDEQGRFTFLNPAALRLLSYDREEELLGRNSHDLIHHTDSQGQPYPEESCPIYQVMQTRIPLEAWQDWFWRRDGLGFPVEVYATPLSRASDSAPGGVVVFRDITEQKRLEAKLEHQATHDRLTGIYNRTKLYELLSMVHQQHLRYGTPFSLILFDIDHFKAVNDQFGHGIGDQVLIEVTSRVRANLRGNDHVGRWGARSS